MCRLVCLKDLKSHAGTDVAGRVLGERPDKERSLALHAWELYGASASLTSNL
jgi:hypothetical protein